MSTAAMLPLRPRLLESIPGTHGFNNQCRAVCMCWTAHPAVHRHIYPESKLWPHSPLQERLGDVAAAVSAELEALQGGLQRRADIAAARATLDLMQDTAHVMSKVCLDRFLVAC